MKAMLPLPVLFLLAVLGEDPCAELQTGVLVLQQGQDVCIICGFVPEGGRVLVNGSKFNLSQAELVKIYPQRKVKFFRASLSRRPPVVVRIQDRAGREIARGALGDTSVRISGVQAEGSRFEPGAQVLLKAGKVKLSIFGEGLGGARVLLDGKKLKVKRQTDEAIDLEVRLKSGTHELLVTKTDGVRAVAEKLELVAKDERQTAASRTQVDEKGAAELEIKNRYVYIDNFTLGGGRVRVQVEIRFRARSRTEGFILEELPAGWEIESALLVGASRSVIEAKKVGDNNTWSLPVSIQKKGDYSLFYVASKQ